MCVNSIVFWIYTSSVVWPCPRTEFHSVGKADQGHCSCCEWRLAKAQGDQHINTLGGRKPVCSVFKGEKGAALRTFEFR